MKRQSLTLAILALLLPAALRALWYYRGVPERSPIATPDYASFERPQADVNAPDLENVEQTGGMVLLDGYHGNQFIPNEIDALTAAIRARGGTIETVTDAFTLEIQLKTASAFVTVSPSASFSQYETQLLKNFTERGGKLLVFADATRNQLYFDYISGNPIAFGDANAANSLLKHYDIAVKNDYLYNTEVNEGNFRNVLFDDFGKSELTFGLDEVALYGARSVTSDSGVILLQGAESNLSSLDDAYDPAAGGAVLSKDGSAAAFGDFTFLSSPYSAYTDNAALIQNLADFILTGSQTPSLDIFPYVFTGDTVTVVVSPDLERDPSLVAALGSLQTSLRALNLRLEFADNMPSSGDVLAIGTFDAATDFEDQLLKADVDLDSDLIATAAFGEINKGGNGLVLFESAKKGNTLVLMAGTPDDLIALLNVISYGTLNSCLTSERVAVCSVGSGEDFFSEDLFGDFFFEETPAEGSVDQSTPEATPTPGG
jgi:hypothetical protein